MHEPAAATEERGEVVLDIGAETGALVLYTAGELLGREIEVSRVDEPCRFVHTVVRRWQTGGAPVYAAVFAALRAGEYVVWRSRSEAARQVLVVGGSIAETTLGAGGSVTPAPARPLKPRRHVSRPPRSKPEPWGRMPA